MNNKRKTFISPFFYPPQSVSQHSTVHWLYSTYFKNEKKEREKKQFEIFCLFWQSKYKLYWWYAFYLHPMDKHLLWILFIVQSETPHDREKFYGTFKDFFEIDKNCVTTKQYNSFEWNKNKNKTGIYLEVEKNHKKYFVMSNMLRHFDGVITVHFYSILQLALRLSIHDFFVWKIIWSHL